jgi:hypothetical protein
VKVYVVPVVKPVTVIGEEEPVAVMFPGFDVTVYCVIERPPVSAGAVKATLADVTLATVATTLVGAPGTVFGIGHVLLLTF